jgi:hypothetical protein
MLHQSVRYYLTLFVWFLTVCTFCPQDYAGTYRDYPQRLPRRTYRETRNAYRGEAYLPPTEAYLPRDTQRLPRRGVAGRRGRYRRSPADRMFRQ